MEVVGFPDYLIYPDGRVWSKKNNIFLKLLLTGDRKKYFQVCLSNIEKQKRFRVNRLVAEHYIPNPENKPQVDHINRNPSDNRVENLRWATNSENQKNKTITKNNKSGHKYISKYKKGWRFSFRGEEKYFKSKIDCICYKFIYLLKIKSLT